MSQSGQQKAQQNLVAITQWIEARDKADDFHEYERQGKINRGAVAQELGFARSVFNQNPAVKTLVSQTEERWFGTKEDAKSLKAAADRSEKRVAKTAADANRLQEEVAKLKAENSMLRKQLEKFKAMSDVIESTGLVRL